MVNSSAPLFRNQKMRQSHLIVIILVLLILAACSPKIEDPATVETSPAKESGLANPDVRVAGAASATPAQPKPKAVRAPLDDLGPAPELSNQVWLNVDQPLRLAELRGSVILLEMWTFG